MLIIGGTNVNTVNNQTFNYTNNITNNITYNITSNDGNNYTVSCNASEPLGVNDQVSCLRIDGYNYNFTINDDVGSDTWNTTAQMRDALNNSGNYNMSFINATVNNCLYFQNNTARICLEVIY